MRETFEGLLQRAKTPEKRAEYEAELAVPEIPRGAEYLWKIFMRLHARRQSTGMGPARISWGELADFQRLTGMRLAPWEVAILEQLDDLALKDRGEKAKG